MALPVFSLCPDSKRSLNPLNFFKKNQGPSTMFDKGVSIYPSSSGCSADIVNHKEPKFHTIFQQTASFHSRSKLLPSYESFVVGGFLGSKSQGRSGNNPQRVWDLICKELPLNLWTECMVPLTPSKHCDFNCVTSPPKKKFAKEESPSTLEVVDKIEFPCVIDLKSPVENPTDNSKQSYAEVAKASSCKSGGSDRTSLQGDIISKTSKREGGSSRKSLTSQFKGSKRKSSRRDRRENSSQKPSSSAAAAALSSSLQVDTVKDLRLCHQQKHFSSLKSADGSRKKADRHYKLLPNSSRRNPQIEQKQESLSRSRRHSNNRSHCDSRHCNRGRSINCDIDMINWRTGEPISSKMGFEQVSDMNDEDFPAEQTLSESFTVGQKEDVNSGEPRKSELSPADVWLDPQSLSPRCRRRSFSSECSVDSDDSFIVFQTGAPSDSLSDLASDWSDCDSDDSFESDSDSLDESDQCDGLTASSLRLKEINDRWQKECPLESDTTSHDPVQNVTSNEEGKKVRFDKSKPIIHRMLTWDFAYRSSRVGPWEELARDRSRFKTRIQQYEGIISPILTKEHRSKILQQFNTMQL